MTKRKPFQQTGNTQTSILLFLPAVLLFASILWAGAVHAGTQVIAGAGPSTKIVTSFVKLLGKTETGGKYQFRVPKKSAKHAGGIKNTKRYIFGRTGRPLNAKEKKDDVDELFLAKMPIAFATGAKTGIKKLTVDQVCDTFTGKVKNWKALGGIDHTVVLITREPREALFLALKKTLPCMRKVAETRYKFKKDRQVVQAIANTSAGAYAIGFGALRNFPKELVLQVEGFNAGVNIGLVFKKKNKDHPLVEAAKKLVGSKEWLDLITQQGMGIPD